MASTNAGLYSNAMANSSGMPARSRTSTQRLSAVVERGGASWVPPVWLVRLPSMTIVTTPSYGFGGAGNASKSMPSLTSWPRYRMHMRHAR